MHGSAGPGSPQEQTQRRQSHGGAGPGRDPRKQAWWCGGAASAGRVTKQHHGGERAGLLGGSVTPCPRHLRAPGGHGQGAHPPPSAPLGSGGSSGRGAVSTPVALRTRGPSEKALRQGDGGAQGGARGHRGPGAGAGDPAEGECLSSQTPRVCPNPALPGDVPQRRGHKGAASFYRRESARLTGHVRGWHGADPRARLRPPPSP